MNLLLAGILVYIVLQLGLGVYVSRRTATESDYLLAGRRLPMGISVMTIFATWFGAETCIGSSGAVYEEGLAGARTDPFGYSICLMLMGFLFAVPFWRRRLTTLGDLFRVRYSPGVEKIAVLLLAPTSIMWAAAQIRAFGQVLSASSELSVNLAIAVAAIVVVAYTSFGGLLADAITDVLQGVVLIVGLVLLLGTVMFTVGWAGISEAFDPNRLSFAGPEGFSPLEQMESWMVPILGSVISQELIARTLAAKSPRVARNSAITAGSLYLLIGFVPLTLGLFGPSLLPQLEHSEQFLPTLAQTMLHPVLYVVFAGALVSAILSTVDSALLAAASLASHNLVVPLLPNPSEKAKLVTARACVVAFGLVAYILARHAEGVYHLVEEASAFGSAGVFTVVVFAIFTRYGGALTAYLTLIGGVSVYVVGAYVLEMDYPYLLSVAVALSCYATAGWFERSPEVWTPATAEAQE